MTVHGIHILFCQKEFRQMAEEIHNYGARKFFGHYTEYLKLKYPKDFKKRFAFFSLATIKYLDFYGKSLYS